MTSSADDPIKGRVTAGDEQAQAADNATPSPVNRPRPAIPVFEKWKLGVEVAVVVVVTIYAGLTYQLWKEAGEANRIARTNLKQIRELAEVSLKENTKAVETAERAWISLRSITSPVITGKESALITLTFQNTGKTPARIISTRVQARPFPASSAFPASPPYDALTTKPRRAVLPPGLPIEVRLIVGLGTNVSVTKALQGTETLYVYGEVSYLDVFERDHTFTLCAYYEVAHAIWSVCPVYNEAT